MKKFDLVYSNLLKEFNVEDRNDPSFYDYVVILLKQIRNNPNLIDPNKLTDLRKTAMDVVKKGYYLFNDEKNNISQKIEFIFKGGKNATKKDEDQSVNNLVVKITSVPPKAEEKPKLIENTYDESSVLDIVSYLETKKTEAQSQAQAGTETPAQVGETPSALPGGAQQPADTSQYLKGL
jgi:hypothetical protein